MPELPEVETIRRALAPRVTGARVQKLFLNRPDLRFPFPQDLAQKLEGRTIERLDRRAKYLLFVLSGGQTLLSHLGMTGNYRFADWTPQIASRYRTPEGVGHDHMVVHLEAAHDSFALIYSDPRRFGFVDIFADPAQCSFLRDLGPEPLGNRLSAPGLAARFAGRGAPVKSVLLDQTVIAGLGNIYVNEALWRSRISPLTPAGRLVTRAGAPTVRLERLVAAVRAVLGEAIQAGGSTLKDFRNADGAPGYFQHSFDVYDREGQACRHPGCGGTVRRIVQSGRSSFYCPACQRK